MIEKGAKLVGFSFSYARIAAIVATRAFIVPVKISVSDYPVLFYPIGFTNIFFAIKNAI